MVLNVSCPKIFSSTFFSLVRDSVGLKVVPEVIYPYFDLIKIINSVYYWIRCRDE